MEHDAKRWLTVVILAAGAVVWLALSVYPMQYGAVESLILAGLLVLFGLFEFVLNGTVVGE